MPAPEFPATGTARISALLAEARHRRDEDLRQRAGDGSGGFRAATPLDHMIELIWREEQQTWVLYEEVR